jgi:hypothetical protein
MFGELAALGRTPRTPPSWPTETSSSSEDPWQGLRELRLRTTICARIDRLYRERALTVHLAETWLFDRLTPAELTAVAARPNSRPTAISECTGHAAMAAKTPAERLQLEPVIAEEGHYANGLILIRAGFARLAQRYGAGSQTVSYLGRGQLFGMEEVVHNCQQSGRGDVCRFSTLRAVGMRGRPAVPTSVVEQHLCRA